MEFNLIALALYAFLGIPIIIQDIKYRNINLWLSVLFLLVATFFRFKLQPIQTIVFLEFSMNLTIVGCLFLILWLYQKIRGNQRLQDTIGKGDVLFIVIFAIVFEPNMFIINLTLGFIFSIVLHLLFKNMQTKHNSVPLVAYLLIYFIAIRIGEMTLN